MLLNKYAIFLIIAILFFIGCKDQSRKDNKQELENMGQKGAIEKYSGYTSGYEQWEKFLACWAAKKQGKSQEQSLIQSGDFRNQESCPDQNTLIKISELEKSLGINLPQSYKDFLVVHERSICLSSSISNQETGFFTLKNIKKLQVYYPSLIQMYKSYPIESPDKEYFVYGINQDDSSGRISNLEESVVIGRYGTATFELILLYPNITTIDGEMESSILFHSGEFRATSFAEMARQLSYFDIYGNEINQVPPYSQDLLKDKCANEIALNNVWWE